MKFVRLDEYRPVRSAEVLEALAVYDELHNLRKEAKMVFGRLATASINLLNIRIAKLVESAEMSGKTQLLLGNMSDELAQIKRRTPDPEQQKQAISKWLFGPGGYQNFLMQYLYDNYMPKLEKSLQRGFGNTPPVDETTAVNIASDALVNFMEQKDTASIVSSLARFDASQGSLLTWVEGGLKAATQRLVAEHFKQKSHEVSMNQSVGDNDDTQLGDMLKDNSGEDAFDIADYSEKADRLITTFANYTRMLEEQMASTDVPAEKFKLQTLLKHISDPANNVHTKIQKLKELATDIDYANDSLAEVKQRKNEFVSSLSGRNPDPNVVGLAQKYMPKFEEKIKGHQAEISANVAQFDAIYHDLSEMAKYDVDTGATLVAPEQQPMSVPDAGAEGAIEPGMAPGTEPVLRKKPRGNRVLLSPADQAIMEERMSGLRDKLRPAIFKAMSFPQGKKDLRARSGNLFGLREVEHNIDNSKDLDALISGDLSSASVKAIYADIVVRGMLYARDQAAIDKAYDPEVIISGSEEIRRALNKFYNFVENELQNNEALKTKEAEYQALPPEEQAKVALSTKTSSGLSPNAFILSKLSELIADPTASQGGTEVNRFRTLYEYFDHMVRASAYESSRGEKFKDKDFADLSDEERNEISRQVYEEQYSAGHRPMYTGRYRDNSKEKEEV